jgi:hypothetical protein
MLAANMRIANYMLVPLQNVNPTRRPMVLEVLLTGLNQMHGDANMDFIERNRAHVIVVIDIVLMYAKQDILLRGHRETEEAINKGNFSEILKFHVKV